MEFIPLENDSEKTKKKKKVTAKSRKNLKVDETSEEVEIQKTKPMLKGKMLEKKNVKNKYKETLALKRKNRVPKKKNQKAKKDGGEELEEATKVESEDVEDEEKEDVEDEAEDEEVEDEEEEEEEETDDEEKAFKKKCREMDEKKKNRLFIKLKKKIHNEAMIKELHPNIRGVIFPRKKSPRWCWAVFASEEKAKEALKQLSKNKDVLASKPNPYEKVALKQKEKMKTVLRKRETKKKLKNFWM